MRQILIVYEEEADENKKITEWFKNLTSIEGCNSRQDDIATRWLIARKDFKETSSHKTKDNWTTLAKSISSIDSFEIEQEHIFEADAVDSLDTKLHEIADSLPYLDCMVYIFIFLRSCDLKSNESFVPFAGVIKRLVEWHNARTSIIGMDSELSPHGQKLVQFVKCQCKSLMDVPEIEWPSWNGKLSVMNLVNNNGHVFPQFSLRCNNWDSLLTQKTPDKVNVKPARRSRRPQKEAVTSKPQSITVCGRQIEILQEVDLRTFPVFMMTSWTLELQSLHDDSKAMKSYVQDMPLTGLLARVKMYYNLQSLPACANTTSFCTSAWKEYITSSPKRISEPAEEQISPCVQFLYLLILPNFCQQVASTNPPLLAKVLLGPTEISPAIVSSLDQKVGPRQTHSKEGEEDLNEINSAILSLPVAKDGRFYRAMRLLQEHQADAASKWHDGHVDISKDDFLHVMEGFQEYAIDSLIEDCPSMGTHRKENAINAQEKCLRWISESTKNLTACPERLALQVLSDRIGKTSCNTENFISSTPLSARKQSKINADKDCLLKAVLESFQLDGTPKESTTTHLKLKGTSICRVPSQPDLSSKWPESQFLNYHDIYYYNTEKDQDFENKFVDLRDKGSFGDTKSSFVTPKKKPPARQLTRLSPIRSRSSPRSKEVNHNFSRSHSQSLSRSSPMKKFKMSSDLFKQPSSLIIRKSPRKRFSSSLTPTSDPPPLKKARSHQIGSLGSLSDLATPVRRSPRKPSNFIPRTAEDSNVKRLSLTPVFDKSVRRSPRKTPGSSSGSFGCDGDSLSRHKSVDLSSSQTSLVSSMRNSSQENPTQDTKAPKMKRSDRHKMRLQHIIATVLKEKDVHKSDTIYSACYRNLFNVSLVLLKTLPNSQNLTEEMKSVVYAQVQQIINLEKRRSGIAL